MSKFLAPIHTHLFNKIKLYEELEKNLIKIYTDNFGVDVNTLIKGVYTKYGTPIEDGALEDLVDTSNIHGWFQNKISLAETRQAGIITEVYKKFGEKAIELTIDTYATKGSNCGKDAKDNYDVESAPQIYLTLNHYVIDGMPCDMVNNITIKEDDVLEWETVQCLHKDYWSEVSGDKAIFYLLRYTFIDSFIKSANSEFSYYTSSIEKDSTEPFTNRIYK